MSTGEQPVISFCKWVIFVWIWWRQGSTCSQSEIVFLNLQIYYDLFEYCYVQPYLTLLLSSMIIKYDWKPCSLTLKDSSMTKTFVLLLQLLTNNVFDLNACNENYFYFSLLRYAITTIRGKVCFHQKCYLIPRTVFKAELNCIFPTQNNLPSVL